MSIEDGVPVVDVESEGQSSAGEEEGSSIESCLMDKANDTYGSVKRKRRGASAGNKFAAGNTGGGGTIGNAGGAGTFGNAGNASGAGTFGNAGGAGTFCNVGGGAPLANTNRTNKQKKDDDKSKALLREGDELYRDGLFREAQDTYLKASSLTSNPGAAYYGAGLCDLQGDSRRDVKTGEYVLSKNAFKAYENFSEATKCEGQGVQESKHGLMLLILLAKIRFHGEVVTDSAMHFLVPFADEYTPAMKDVFSRPFQFTLGFLGAEQQDNLAKIVGASGLIAVSEQAMLDYFKQRAVAAESSASSEAANAEFMLAELLAVPQSHLQFKELLMKALLDEREKNWCTAIAALEQALPLCPTYLRTQISKQVARLREKLKSDGAGRARMEFEDENESASERPVRIDYLDYGPAERSAGVRSQVYNFVGCWYVALSCFAHAPCVCIGICILAEVYTPN